MDMNPINHGGQTAPGGALPGSGRASFGQAAVSALSMRWSALHDAASAIASLAGIEPEPMNAQQRNFPAVMRDSGGWRRELAEQGVEDLTAILEPGLSALLAVHARGADATSPAGALWEEFCRARDALLSLMPPPSQQTRRSA
jgi:hypothetical protein